MLASCIDAAAFSSVLMACDNQRGKSGGSKRAAARAATSGVLRGPWSLRARSFDAPGRAGTVTYQDSTAASSIGGRAFGVEMSLIGERKGSEDRATRRICKSQSISGLAANDAPFVVAGIQGGDAMSS